MSCRSMSVALVLAFMFVAAAPAQWTTVPVTAPRVQYRTFQSAAAGATVSFHIYTPPDYDSQPSQRFPVLYWLHGSGSATAGIPTVSSWFASAMGRGELPPLLVVFPNGWPNGMYCDAADGTRPVETVIMQELIPHVDGAFRTIANRRGRIVEGFSMGGYGTGRFAFKYSDRFVAASLFGAGPVQLDFMQGPIGTNVPPATREAIFADVWNSDPEIFFAASPWNLAQVNAGAILANQLRIRMAVGESDAMLAPNAELHAHLVSLGISHTWQTYPGIGHDPLLLLQALGPTNWDFYRRALAPCIADTDDGSGTGTPDGGVTIDDLLYDLAIFEAGSIQADVDDGSGTGTPDEGVTIDDLLFYLLRFEQGC